MRWGLPFHQYDVLVGAFFKLLLVCEHKAVALIKENGVCIFLKHPQVIAMQLLDREGQKSAADAHADKEGVDIQLSDLSAADADKTFYKLVVIQVYVLQLLRVLQVLICQRQHLHFAEGDTIVLKNMAVIGPLGKN